MFSDIPHSGHSPPSAKQSSAVQKSGGIRAVEADTQSICNKKMMYSRTLPPRHLCAFTTMERLP
jgi:hypothetical protein